MRERERYFFAGIIGSYEIRKRLSIKLMRFSIWLYPKNPLLKEYIDKMIADYVITGKHITRIDYNDVFKKDSE